MPAVLALPAQDGEELNINDAAPWQAVSLLVVKLSRVMQRMWEDPISWRTRGDTSDPHTLIRMLVQASLLVGGSFKSLAGWLSVRLPEEVFAQPCGPILLLSQLRLRLGHLEVPGTIQRAYHKAQGIPAPSSWIVAGPAGLTCIFRVAANETKTRPIRQRFPLLQHDPKSMSSQRTRDGGHIHNLHK